MKTRVLKQLLNVYKELLPFEDACYETAVYPVLFLNHRALPVHQYTPHHDVPQSSDRALEHFCYCSRAN